jgi:hypothetical protein
MISILSGAATCRKRKIMNAEYNERDWAALCATTDTLFAEFGSRRLAFAEACRRNPGLSATPPTTSQAPVATPGATQGRPEDSPIVRACEALAAAATPAAGDPLTRATPAPQEVSGPEGSPIVKACERLSAAATRAAQ